MNLRDETLLHDEPKGARYRNSKRSFMCGKAGIGLSWKAVCHYAEQPSGMTGLQSENAMFFISHHFEVPHVCGLKCRM